MIATLLFGVAGTALAADDKPLAFPGLPVDARSLDQEALQRLGVHLIVTQAGRAPGVVATIGPGGNAARLYMRGLGTPDPFAPQPVATIVDSVPLPNGISNNFILFDPEAVSIHSGAFGTSSGPQALGGAISVRNQAPGQRVGGFVEAGFGSEARWLLRGSVDVPFDERVAFKLSAYWQGDHGFAHNLTTGERVNDGDMSGVRLAVRLQPATGFNWDLAAAYTENNGENLLNFPCKGTEAQGCNRYLTTGMSTVPRLNGQPQYSVPITGRKADFPLGSEVKTMLLTSRMEWSGDLWRIAAITGYVDSQARQALDFGDGRSGFGPLAPPQGFQNGGASLLHDGITRQFSQELRASAIFGLVEVTAGGWFANSTNRADTAMLTTFADGTAEGQTTLQSDAITNMEIRQLAGFAEATFTKGPFVANAGVRYTDLQGGSAGATVGSGLWSPHAELSWRPDEATRLFVRATKGFVADIRPVQGADAVTAGWTYEGGLETRLAAERLILSVTGFALDIDNVNIADWLAPPQPLATLKNHGAEVELLARPLSRLAIWLNGGWQRARFGDASLGTPVYAPNVTAAAGGTYDLPIPYAGVVLTPMLEVRYRASMATDRQTQAGSSVLANASLAIRTDDDNWMLALECRNCLDSADPDASFHGWTYPQLPRTWMLRARRNF